MRSKNSLNSINAKLPPIDRVYSLLSSVDRLFRSIYIRRSRKSTSARRTEGETKEEEGNREGRTACREKKSNRMDVKKHTESLFLPIFYSFHVQKYYTMIEKNEYFIERELKVDTRNYSRKTCEMLINYSLRRRRRFCCT